MIDNEQERYVDEYLEDAGKEAVLADAQYRAASEAKYRRIQEQQPWQLTVNVMQAENGFVVHVTDNSINGWLNKSYIASDKPSVRAIIEQHLFTE